MSRPAAAALLFALFALVPGCKCARAEAPDAGDDEDQVRPVFDIHTPADPLAARLCDALYKLPAERRGQCCPGAASPAIMLPQCTGLVSSALKIGAVKLEPEAVDRCARAMAGAYSGCAWAGPNEVPLPEDCSGLFKGTLAKGARCRSTLECQGDLRCAGAGPTDTGRCAPAGPEGAPCETAVDALASFTQQDVTRSHPECEGFCQRRRCKPAPADGKCLNDVQCPRGTHCGGGTCAPGAAAKEGEPCSPGGCQAPLRCIKDTCRAPAPDGTSCTVHGECLGACIAGDGGAGARCGPGCAFR